MTFTTHAIVGAAAATLFPSQPVLAFAAGFASHLAIDSLPHWDYKILSRHDESPTEVVMQVDTRSPKFLYDILRIGSDGVLGTILAVFIFSFWLFHFPIWFVVLGAWAGILPDQLQFVYSKTRTKFLLPLQLLHVWVQKGKSIYPSPLVGLLYQFVLVVVIVGLRKFFG